MIELHNLKGGIIGQIQKNLHGEDVKLLASNINQTSGTSWQTVVKFRSTAQHFPAQYNFALCLHSAFDKDSPFVISLSEAEAKSKLQSWGIAAAEIEKLILTEVE